MALWVDKYRPRELSDLTYHVKQAKDLIEIVKVKSFSFILRQKNRKRKELEFQ